MEKWKAVLIEDVNASTEAAAEDNNNNNAAGQAGNNGKKKKYVKKKMVGKYTAKKRTMQIRRVEQKGNITIQ